MRAAEIARWHVRDMLTAYRELLRRKIIEQYRHDMLMWAILAPHQKESKKAPRLPPWVREG